MDVDAYVAAHRAEWRHLEHLVRRAARPRRLTGAEVDELVELYQRAATHLSVVQSRSPDPALVARLSSLVARARAAVTGASAPAWREVGRFFWVAFPAAAWRARRWWLGAAAGSLAVAVAFAIWLVTHPDVQAQMVPADALRQLVERDFANYYREHPAADFAARVWTNNAWVAAGTLSLGVLLGVPTVWILLTNSVNLGFAAGVLVSAGKANVFFGLVTPHGLLELTAVFLAAGVGLRLGWTVIDPGPRKRTDALGAEGRAAVTVALGLVAVLLVSGVIEAFVTPSPLPTWARVGIGVLAEAVFLGYVAGLGRRAVRAGETGDLPLGERPDVAPAAG